MNGEPMSYSFAAPLEWAEFTRMPLDIQQMYLDTLKEKFDGVPGAMIAESLGVPQNTFGPYLSKRGLVLKRAPGTRPNRISFMKTEDGEAWEKWHEVYRKNPKEEEAAPAESAPAEEAATSEPSAEEAKEQDAPKAVYNFNERPVESQNAALIAALISSLAGTGAKVTIEINL